MDSRVKPRLRGVSHQFACFVAAGAGAVLIAMSANGRVAAATAVYAASLAVMFGTSAIYHRIDWSPPASARMKRLDHSAIFLIIAGTYTPICVLAIGGADGRRLLALVWAGAALGILQAIFWARAPRAVRSLLYVGLGWMILADLGAVRAALGPATLALLLAGGLLYTAGAVVYALRRPDPAPRVFGYHEIFHGLVVAASAFHFAAIILMVRAASG